MENFKGKDVLDAFKSSPFMGVFNEFLKNMGSAEKSASSAPDGGKSMEAMASEINQALTKNIYPSA